MTGIKAHLSAELIEKKTKKLNDEVEASSFDFSLQVDDESIDWKMFPRAAALAERLWSNPSEKWYKAERRILWQRLRSIRRGYAADVLQVLDRLQDASYAWKGGVSTVFI